MKFAYKFNNLLGTVYKKGPLLFSEDGNFLISPVGNRITIFDLKNNKTVTLPIESNYNYNCLALSPSGFMLIAINEAGDASLISLISQTVVQKYRFKSKCRAVEYSPCGKYFAVCKENNVFVYKAPGPLSGQYNAFVMERVFRGATDETTNLSWSFDSKILAVGSKDMSVKLYPMDKYANFRIYSLGNHTDTIVACYFEDSNYDMITISRNGQMCMWECSLNPEDLIPLQGPPKKKRKKQLEELQEDEIDLTKSLENDQSECRDKNNEKEENIEDKPTDDNKFFYKRLARHYLADEARIEDREAVLTAAAYHRKNQILVTGWTMRVARFVQQESKKFSKKLFSQNLSFNEVSESVACVEKLSGFSSGSFFIHELPDVNLILSRSILGQKQKVSTITMNSTGDWIALGYEGFGQLLVHEWQSETDVLKQQGHSNNITCVTYSKDGQFLATGGEDGKVKLWSVLSGLCFVTFPEHTSAVSAIACSGNKKFIVSASLDGTVRAFDLKRYRNFKTFTAPRLIQFASVSVDSSGEFVAAGGQDVFEIFLWSVRTGRLMEVLSGHEGPVTSLAFSPNLSSSAMVSVSWDKTLRVWDALEKGSAHETLELTSDGLCVAFKPNGEEVACATLSGQIMVFDLKTSNQVATIEGRNDLGSGRSDTDLVTAKKSLEGKAFTSLCYSADGEYLIAGGQSKNVCIYHVKESILIKKFEITQNRSLDAVDDFINRRKLVEFGNLALVEEREEREGGNVSIRLPGVRKGDMASRSFKPEVRVFSLQFSPTGEQWVAATTEGLLIYSLDAGLTFDPWDLQIGITPMAVREAIKNEDYYNGLTMAMKLNEPKLMQEAIESIPVKDVELTVTNLGERHASRLLGVLSSNLDSSHHLEYYLVWTKHLLTLHGRQINPQINMPALAALEKSLVRKYDQLTKICDFNQYNIANILQLAADIAAERPKQEIDSENDSDFEHLASNYLSE